MSGTDPPNAAPVRPHVVVTERNAAGDPTAFWFADLSPVHATLAAGFSGAFAVAASVGVGVGWFPSLPPSLVPAPWNVLVQWLVVTVPPGVTCGYAVFRGLCRTRVWAEPGRVTVRREWPGVAWQRAVDFPPGHRAAEARVGSAGMGPKYAVVIGPGVRIGGRFRLDAAVWLADAVNGASATDQIAPPA